MSAPWRVFRRRGREAGWVAERSCSHPSRCVSSRRCGTAVNTRGMRLGFTSGSLSQTIDRASKGECGGNEKRGREVTRLAQRVMYCPCGNAKVLALGLCSTCYTLKRQDEEYFGGVARSGSGA